MASWAERLSVVTAGDSELLFAVMALAAMSSTRPRVNALNSPGFCLPTIPPIFASVSLVLFLLLTIESSPNVYKA